MYAIKVDAVTLTKLRKLADWQLRQHGVDPDSVTQACIQADEDARHWVRYTEDTHVSADGKFRITFHRPGRYDGQHVGKYVRTEASQFPTVAWRNPVAFESFELATASVASAPTTA